MTQFVNKSTVPVVIIFLVAIGFFYSIAQTSAPSLSINSGSSASIAEYETTSIEVVFISPHEDGDYKEFNGEEGPEGPRPQLPDGKGPIKIFILQEAARKIIELRDQTGNVIAKITWTLSDLSGFVDDWAGPRYAWSSKVEVLNGYGGNGIALWLWKFAERQFYEPGMTRVIVDMAVSQSGKTGWTTYHLQAVLSFIQQNVSNFSFLMNDPNLKIWVIQYP